jgi:hypothetical protein
MGMVNMATRTWVLMVPMDARFYSAIRSSG